MTGMINPDDWESIVPLLGDVKDVDQLLSKLKARDRLLDSNFYVIDVSTYTPVLRQNTLVVASTVYVLQGYRVGPFVNLNVQLKCDGVGTAATFVDVSLPPQLPLSLSNLHTNGIFRLFDQSANTFYVGASEPSLSDPTYIRGIASGGTTFLGGSIFTAALAINDTVGFSVQYMTSLPSL